MKNYSFIREYRPNDPCSCQGCFKIGTRYLEINCSPEPGPYCDDCANDLLMHLIALKSFDEENMND